MSELAKEAAWIRYLLEEVRYNGQDLIGGFDILTGHNPEAPQPALQFVTVKASIRASL
jgi:hypothetical protein